MSFTKELVPLPSGLSLEASLYTPIGHAQSEKNGLVVCSHPWSRLGGSIDDPLLSYLTDYLVQDHNYHVLRFNSRGVGKSSGWPSFTGLTEGKDLEELVQWALGTVPNVKSLVLLGYSHGSLITSLHPVLPSEIKTSHILLSYSLGPRTFLTAFHAGTYAEKLQATIRNPRSNVLIIYGDHDQFTSDKRYRQWAEELKKDSGGDRLRVERVEGASHFWVEHVNRLAHIVGDWIPMISEQLS